jgi:porphobilinogen deaminase
VYRKEDEWVRKAVYCVNHQETRITVSVETGIMKLMGAIQISPVAVNASMEFDAIRVRSVSYGYTDEPRRVEGYLPMDYVMDEVLSFAEYLVGKRDYLL